jgi:hypothetical protein
MVEDVGTDLQAEVFSWVDRIETDLALDGSKFALPSTTGGPARSDIQPIRNALVDAQELLKRLEIRQHICPSLKVLSDDAKDYAKVIAAAILPISIAGTIPIPLNPLLFAALAVVIARMGIKTFCPD